MLSIVPSIDTPSITSPRFRFRGSHFNKRPSRDSSILLTAPGRGNVETRLNNANGRASADAKTRDPKKKRRKKKKITLEKQKIRQISREEKKKWHGPKDCLLALFPLRVWGAGKRGERASRSNPQRNDFMLIFRELQRVHKCVAFTNLLPLF